MVDVVAVDGPLSRVGRVKVDDQGLHGPNDGGVLSGPAVSEGERVAMDMHGVEHHRHVVEPEPHPLALPHLKRVGANTLVFSGCNFPNCPRTSIYEASERDYRVVLAEDAVSGLYDQGRTELSNIGVRLMDTPAVLRALARG